MPLAFTIVEVIAAVIILAVLVGMAAAGYDMYQKARRVKRGLWILAPGTIPASPQTGTLMYRVVVENGNGKLIGTVPGHGVTFTLVPGGASAGAVQIVSVTNGVSVVPVAGLSGTGTTDASGLITVIVEFEQHRSGALTAADAATGASDASDTVGITAF